MYNCSYFPFTRILEKTKFKICVKCPRHYKEKWSTLSSGSNCSKSVLAKFQCLPFDTSMSSSGLTENLRACFSIDII